MGGFSYPAPSPIYAPVRVPTYAPTPYLGLWLTLGKQNCGAGSDLSQITVNTITACRSQCITTNGCLGVVYTTAVSSSRTCWLKSSLASCASSATIAATDIQLLSSHNTDFVYAPNFGCISIQNPTSVISAAGNPDDCFQSCLYPSCFGFLFTQAGG